MQKLINQNRQYKGVEDYIIIILIVQFSYQLIPVNLYFGNMRQIVSFLLVIYLSLDTFTPLAKSSKLKSAESAGLLIYFVIKLF